jgi:hypothetical protein
VSLSSAILFNLITAVLMRELTLSSKSAEVLITPGLSVRQLEHTLKIWTLHTRIKLRLQKRLLKQLTDLVTDKKLTIEEFETLTADLIKAFTRAPTNLQVKHLVLNVQLAENRKMAAEEEEGGESGANKAREGAGRKALSMKEWQEIQTAELEGHMRNVSAVVNLVLDVRASKVNSSLFAGNKHRAIFQRQLKKDICHLLQCPDEQVVCVDIARHNTGEPGRGGVDDYGYTSAKIVLLPLMKEDGVAVSPDGVLREPQAPHALVADLLGLLASQVSDLRGGVEEDTHTINFLLPTCKCSVVSAQVLSGAYSGDTIRVPGEGCVAADESGLQEKLAKAMRMSDKRRTRELVKAHERERERTLMASIHESRGIGTASVLLKSPLDSNAKLTGGVVGIEGAPMLWGLPTPETYSLAKEEERKRQEAAARKRERQRGEQTKKELAEMSQSSALTPTNSVTNSTMTSSSSLAYARRNLQLDRNKGERDTNKRLSEDTEWTREVSYFVGLQQDLKRVCSSRTASELDKKQADSRISRALLNASDTMIDLYVRCGVPLTSPSSGSVSTSLYSKSSHLHPRDVDDDEIPWDTEGSVTVMSEDMPSSWTSSRKVRDEEGAWDTEGSGIVMSENMQSNVLKSLSLHMGDAGGDGSMRGQNNEDVRDMKWERVPSWITETEVESAGGGESDVAGDQEGVQGSLSKIPFVKLERVPSWITETEVESEEGEESDVAGNQQGVNNLLPGKLERISSWITSA